MQTRIHSSRISINIKRSPDSRKPTNADEYERPLGSVSARTRGSPYSKLKSAQTVEKESPLGSRNSSRKESTSLIEQVKSKDVSTNSPNNRNGVNSSFNFLKSNRVSPASIKDFSSRMKCSETEARFWLKFIYGAFRRLSLTAPKAKAPQSSKRDRSTRLPSRA